MTIAGYRSAVCPVADLARTYCSRLALPTSRQPQPLSARSGQSRLRRRKVCASAATAAGGTLNPKPPRGDRGGLGRCLRWEERAAHTANPRRSTNVPASGRRHHRQDACGSASMRYRASSPRGPRPSIPCQLPSPRCPPRLRGTPRHIRRASPSPNLAAGMESTSPPSKAFGAGKIVLPAPNSKARGLRYAPSFCLGGAPETNPKPYNASTLAKFLGMSKCEWKVDAALSALALIEQTVALSRATRPTPTFNPPP